MPCRIVALGFFTPKAHPYAHPAPHPKLMAAVVGGEKRPSNTSLAT